MKILNIVRSELDETERILLKEVSKNVESIILPLYQEHLDYDKMVREIFTSDKVISWW